MFAFIVILHILSFQMNSILAETPIGNTTDEPEMIHETSSQIVISTIIEVEGNPETHQKYIEAYFPTVEVIATYDKLFNGIALKGRSDRIMRLTDLAFVKGIYPVQTYTTLQPNTIVSLSQPHKTKQTNQVTNIEKKDPNVMLPYQLNTTTFTGKGVKVGVVDTGVDFNHPDLVSNYKGGFDLVDLDDEPMETTEEEGMPTNHGTHVAGIIAANGELKGVAPEADIYAYRALGPGGFGTSIQVIAAMEEAVKDGVDIINLSLGNTINGPDYPTSKAVNEATKLGVAVVVANGNAGPNDWTIGAPATAPAAFSVGAYQQSGKIPFLYEPANRKKIQLSPFIFSKSWDMTRDYQMISMEKKTKETGPTENDSTTNKPSANQSEVNNQLDNTQVRGKIGLFKLKDEPLADTLMHFEKAGGVAAIIYGITPKNEHWLPALREVGLTIPVAQVANKDGKWLEEMIQQQADIYFENIQETSNQTIASFSSRGPVTVNWMLKPDVIAPGVNILSTIPGGYDMLNGTSMAAPHIAGAIAVIKEAKPAWTNKQIFGAIRTTATKIETDDNEKAAPIIQGAGLIDIEAAVNTDTIIDNSLLSFGKIGNHTEERTIELTVENVSDKRQTYYFTIPKKERGVTWQLPRSIIIEGNDKATIPITLKVNTLQLEEGMYEGWLTLHSNDTSYDLPYLFISETADYPRVMGFSFRKSESDQRKYKYQFYAAERVQSIRVQLYEPNSLVYEGTLLTLTDLKIGMNEGEIRKDRIDHRGTFHGIILVQLEDGELMNYSTEIIIE